MQRHSPRYNVTIMITGRVSAMTDSMEARTATLAAGPQATGPSAAHIITAMRHSSVHAPLQ